MSLPQRQKQRRRDDVDPADIQREREVLTAQAKESGRPRQHHRKDG